VHFMKRTGRAIGRGLAKVDDLTSDTLIAFAAKAGSTAADGIGANSPCTTALVKHLTTPGLDLRLALGRVRDEVIQTTSSRQEPFVYGLLGGAEIPLVPSVKPDQARNVAQPPSRAPVLPSSPASEAAEAWAAAKDATNIRALEAFIARYPNTYFADLARLRMGELKAEQAAAAPPAARMVPPTAESLQSGQPADAASRQEPSCTYYRVEASLLNVSKDVGGNVCVDVLEGGQIACVTRKERVDTGDWGYIAHKLERSNGRTPVNGWSVLRSMQEVSSADVATLAEASPRSAAVQPEEILRFDQPVPFGPFPVNGRSIKELAASVPLFPPIADLEEALWKQKCTSCHHWDKALLCEQGKTYVKAPRMILRHPDPYGGAYKIALMRWAKSGCE
jgi:hypothetical protein